MWQWSWISNPTVFVTQLDNSSFVQHMVLCTALILAPAQAALAMAV